MKEIEIQERNKQIALMLGWKVYSGLNPRWKDSFETNCRSEIFEEFVEVLLFHSDWNWLMKVIDFIENKRDYVIHIDSSPTLSNKWLIHRVEIVRNNATLYKSGDRIVKIESDYSNNQSKKETVFIAISSFAKAFNKKEL